MAISHQELKPKNGGARDGAEYLASLRDGRVVFIDGEPVRDVARDPRFRGAVLSVADLYDQQHETSLREQMTFQSPSSGAQVGLSYIQPRSEQDLRRRRDMVKNWMDRVGGMMGRTPDFLNVMISGYAAAHESFAVGGAQFARNIVRYHEFIRENDLALTHSLVTPDIDKTKPIFGQPGDLAMKAVRDTDAGIYVTGARSVATLGPLANEIVVFPSPTKFPLVEEAKSYAVAFAAPADTPGITMICRPSLAARGAFADHPLSARMDEMDAVIWFDNVFIPWERVFIYRNIEATEAVRKSPSGHGAHQAAIRSLAKVEFLLGLAFNLVDSNKSGGPQVLGLLSELINSVEMIRGLLRAAEVDCRPGPDGTVVPFEEPLAVIRFAFPSIHARALEILQTLGSGNLVVAPSHGELAGEAAPIVERYCAGANITADRKIALLRLAWDASCSAFAGRQNLYEKFFSGDPWRNASMRAERYAGARNLKDRVWKFLERNDEWERRLNQDS